MQGKEVMERRNWSRRRGQSLIRRPMKLIWKKKTAQTLQYVEGVGRVNVMITLKSSGQKIVEKDQQSSSQTTEEEDSEGGTRTSQDSSSDKTSIYEQDADD